MFWDSPDFPFVRHLEAHFVELRSEADALAESEYLDWPLSEAYRGGWKVFCIASRDPAWLLAPYCEPNARRCPRTARCLARIPGLVRGGFSLLLPDTLIHRHVDEVSDDFLRCHLALRTNPGALMRFGELTTSWREGRCLLFDGRAEHEAANLGQTPRIVCLVDVERASLPREVGA